MFYLCDFQVCYSQIVDAGELWFVSRVKQPSGTPCPCKIDSYDPETEERCVVRTTFKTTPTGYVCVLHLVFNLMILVSVASLPYCGKINNVQYVEHWESLFI